jgi:peptidoglycan hydrolase-like protein with peptidoglycan-binding domain
MIMPHSLIWLKDVLKTAGLKVATTHGWEDRGHGDMGQILGVMCHHTAGSRTGNMPSLDTLIKGREDLPGPLAQLGLARDGTYYIIAAGRCYHAGDGIWKGFVNGNSNFIGIEGENTGRADDFPWPEVQMDAYRRGVAAILKFVGREADFCAGHKEYALPKGRKSDSSFNMDTFRSMVAEILAGSAPAPVLIPAAERTAQGRPTLRRGSAGPFVQQVQLKLKMDADGLFGAATEAAIRNFQRGKQAVPDGIVGPKTWQLLDTIT